MNAILAIVIRRLPWLIAGAVLVALVLGVPAFQRPRYWLSMAPQYFAPAALAIALTPIILTGGIDLSVGSITVLSSVVIGVLWRDLGLPIGVALVADGFQFHIPRGYIYSAMAFAAAVEAFNVLARSKRRTATR